MLRLIVLVLFAVMLGSCSPSEEPTPAPEPVATRDPRTDPSKTMQRCCYCIQGNVREKMYTTRPCEGECEVMGQTWSGTYCDE